MTAPDFPNRREIEAAQFERLRTMLKVLLPTNRFYAPRLASAELTADLPDLATFFAQIPFTRKQDLVDDQQQHPPYGTNLTFPLERYVRFNQTSGTTGVPLRWLDTVESWEWMAGNWCEVFRASGVVPADRIFYAFSFGPFLGFWTAFDAGQRMGCLCLPGGGMSSPARLRTILDNAVTVLCCTPTYALRLGEVAEEESLSLSASSVRAILLAGEPGASIPATRARIEALWPGARVYDHHGMTETGPVSIPCPARPDVLHVLESGFLPEVIDPQTGQTVPPGGTGELILTNLGRIGSPLLRYRTGDIVKTATETPCACGRYDLALEGGILGRADDMVIVRGVNIHPTAIEAIVRRFSEVAEYRVELWTEREMQEIALFIEPTPECTESSRLQASIETALREAFHLRVPVTLAEIGTLPRFELKAKRWVRRAAEE
jgi:phenylacetate-CoA ligase